MEYSEVQYIEVQSSDMQYIEVQYSEVQWSAVQWSAVRLGWLLCYFHCPFLTQYWLSDLISIGCKYNQYEFEQRMGEKYVSSRVIKRENSYVKKI